MHEQMQRLTAAARELSGVVSPSALAARLGVSHQNINTWSRRGVSLAGLIAAHKEFGCSIEWLATGVGRMSDAPQRGGPARPTVDDAVCLIADCIAAMPRDQIDALSEDWRAMLRGADSQILRAQVSGALRAAHDDLGPQRAKPAC